MRWVNRPHVYHAGNKRSTTPPSLGFWFSRSKHSFPPRGRSENHCEGGGDFKQPEEGRGGETCSGGWGRRTLGLRRLVQERACEVKPWTHDEPSPVPSRSLPLTRTDASSHTRGATWGAEAHSWDIQGCGGSSVQHALGILLFHSKAIKHSLITDWGALYQTRGPQNKLHVAFKELMAPKGRLDSKRLFHKDTI